MNSAVPEGWENRQFGQFCREKSVKFDGKSELPVLSVTKYDGFVSSLDYFNKQVFSRDLSSYKVVRKGQFAYATIHLDEGSLGLLSDYDGGLISPMYTVFETTQECDSKFLFFLMKSDLYMTKYPALGQGSINRRMSISFRSLSELNIATPPLPEQKKIASILTSVDEVIENTQKQIDKLQDLKKATMNELLTKGIGHTEFKDSELGRIPKSWEVKKFSHITHLITKGTTPASIGFSFSESGINFIKVESIVSDGNIDPAKFSYVDENVHNKLRRSQICKEDILIAIAGTVGKLAIAEQKFLPANTNQALAIVRLKKEIVRPLFAFYFLQGWYIKTLIGRSQTVGAQPNVSLAQIANFPIPLIDVMEQDLIVKSLRSFDKAIADVKRKLSQTQSLKKSLMQDLLTGKVRVTVN